MTSDITPEEAKAAEERYRKKVDKEDKEPLVQFGGNGEEEPADYYDSEPSYEEVEDTTDYWGAEDSEDKN